MKKAPTKKEKTDTFTVNEPFRTYTREGEIVFNSLSKSEGQPTETRSGEIRKKVAPGEDTLNITALGA